MTQDYKKAERMLNGLVDLVNNYNSEEVEGMDEKMYVIPIVDYTAVIVKPEDYARAAVLQEKGINIMKELKEIDNGICDNT